MDNINVETIVIGERYRKDLGDLTSLVDSINSIGLLHPVVIDSRNILIAGERRIEAWKLSDYSQDNIPVTVIDIGQIILGERDENFVRKDFTLGEAVAIKQYFEPFEEQAAKDRKVDSGQTYGVGQTKIDSGDSPPSIIKSRDKVAAFTGYGERKLAHAEVVIQAAKENPEDYHEYADQMEKTGNAEGAYKAVRKKRAKIDRQVKSDAWDSQRKNTSNLPEFIPVLYVTKADSLPLEDESVDLIITSPPYNLGGSNWPMGGGSGRKGGVGYDDDMPESDYQEWQLLVFEELYRVAKNGASFFYNHKVRQLNGTLIHPVEWILRDNPWTLRQELIWDRESTHNHVSSLFWQEDERIYWMTKGKPNLPDGSIHKSTVWTFAGPTSGQWHPAPFAKDLPVMLIEAVAIKDAVILDPFGGSMTTCLAAQELGFNSIGVDRNEEYVKQARSDNGW